VIKNSDLWTKKNFNQSKDLDATAVAYPCGAMARAYFNGRLV
jgi:hypothetical protein